MEKRETSRICRTQEKENSTYVIITILRQKSDSPPPQIVCARALSDSSRGRTEKLLLRADDIGDEVSVGEGVGGRSVNDGCTGSVVVAEGAEEREIGEGGEETR